MSLCPSATINFTPPAVRLGCTKQHHPVDEEKTVMGRFLRLATLLLLCSAVAATGEPVWGQNKNGVRTGSYRYSFSYTPIYQFETDLDNGGSFDVSRHYVRFDVTRSFGRSLRMGLGLSYDFEKWNFRDLPTVAGATPWSSLHRPGVSLPVFYTFADSWILGITPTVEFSGESGAQIDESLIYGGIVSLAHPFSRDLFLGIGFGVFDQLEDTSFFPFVIIEWTISEQFRVTNPLRAGPAGPAGLELVYAPVDNWELGVGGAYRTYRFRLDDQSAVPDGVGENEFLVAFLRLQRKIGARLTLDLTGGALFGGELSIDNVDGDEIGSDDYDPSPFLALTFAGEF
jgi:hypothetical protein